MNVVRIFAAAGLMVLGTSAAYAAMPTRYHGPQTREGRAAYRQAPAIAGASRLRAPVPEPEYFQHAQANQGTGVDYD